MYGLKEDWALEPKARHFVLEDYEGAVPRWCPGCGDHAVLSATQRLLRDEQLEPENIVMVSGIGCSSRFPHYMKTYGFHSLHGRALPVASGIKARRPDLNVFVSTGDGDNCAIGTGHWIHAIRYNMDMVVMLFDNNIYGLTKMQTSPTTNLGQYSNTHPRGAILSPLNPLSVTLGITNASFVAQTVDWNPAHLYATIRAGFRHNGLSFIRILQRCPHYMPVLWDAVQNDPSRTMLLTHPDGIQISDGVSRLFPNKQEHDPTDLSTAKELVLLDGIFPVGLLYHNENAEHYDVLATEGMDMSSADKLKGFEAALDKFQI